jgi:hypothetical protein
MSDKIGSSILQLMAATPEQITTFFKELKKSGGNISKFFLHRTWPSVRVGTNDYDKEGQPVGWKQCIYKKVGEWTEPDKYPGMVFPLFDLEQWDDVKIATLRHILQEAKRIGVALIMSIHDFCSIKRGQRKRCYPFDACQQQHELWVETLKDQPDSHHGFITGGRYHEGTGREHVRYWYARELDKIFELIHEAGNPDVYFMPMNEADYLNPGQMSEDEQDKLLISFHRWYKAELLARGVQADHIIISTSRAGAKMRSDSELSKCLFEIHGCNSPEQMDVIKKAFPASNVVGNGDGPDDHAKGNLATIGGDTRNCSPEQAKEMADYIKAHAIPMYESFDRKIEASWPADFSRIGFQPWVKAMADGLELQKYKFVKVCSESWQIPNQYCPSTREEMFEEGLSIPPCTIHHAPTPEPEPTPQPMTCGGKYLNPPAGQKRNLWRYILCRLRIKK